MNHGSFAGAPTTATINRDEPNVLDYNQTGMPNPLSASELLEKKRSDLSGLVGMKLRVTLLRSQPIPGWGISIRAFSGTLREKPTPEDLLILHNTTLEPDSNRSVARETPCHDCHLDKIASVTYA